LLARTRADVNRLWKDVSEHNRAHGIDDDRRIEVTFYFGQHVASDDGPAADETQEST
jgi:hypothetical protein